MDDSTIAARINGRTINFQILREELSMFEASLAKPAYATFGALLRGEWTLREVKAILTFAASQTRVGEHDRMMFETLGHVPPASLRRECDEQRHVAETLKTKPPAKYAVLAKQILAATLFGASGDDLVFTDEADGEE